MNKDANYIVQNLKSYIQLKKDKKELVNPDELDFMLNQFVFDCKLYEIEQGVKKASERVEKIEHQKFEISQNSSKKDTSKLEILKKFIKKNE